MGWRAALAGVALALAGFATAHAGPQYVRAGRLLDVANGQVHSDRLVTIVDGRIAAVGPWTGPPADGPTLDWSRYTVLPGLIDLHTHVADGFGQSNDPAEPLKHGPAETALKGAETARAMLRSGFTTVRDVGAYRGLSDVVLRDAIARGWVDGPRMIVAGGYITTPGGGGAVTGLKTGQVAPQEFRMGEVRGVWLDMDIYNGDWIEEFGTKEGWPAEYQRKNRETTDVQREGFRKAVAAGVKLSFGTDAGVYPYGLAARQFAYMVRYGMTPAQAIRSATVESAAALGMERDLGQTAPGFAADLIAVDGDPLADVRVLERVAGVVKGGRLVAP